MVEVIRRPCLASGLTGRLPSPGLFSGEATAAANLLMCRGHAVNGVTDRVVQEIWRERRQAG